MRTIFTFIFLFLSLFNRVYSQNESSEKSAESSINEITNFIFINNSDQIWQVCNAEFKAKTNANDFSKLIEHIFNYLKDNAITKVSQYKSQSQSLQSINNGLLTKCYSQEYTMMPEYYGKITPLLSQKKVGNKLIIDLKQSNQTWLLDNLVFENNYLDSNFDMNKYIQDFFFNEKDEKDYNVNFIIYSEKEQNNGVKQLLKKDWEIFSILKNVSYVSEKEAKVNILKDKVYALSFSKEVKSNSKLSDIDKLRVAFAGPSKINFELTFCPEYNYIILSNGEKYAIYTINNLENLSNIKDFVKNKLLTIN